jgi:hypothetical protein
MMCRNPTEGKLGINYALATTMSVTTTEHEVTNYDSAILL